MRPPFRYAFLDALRGIAAVLVVWQHAAQYIPRRWPEAVVPGAWSLAFVSWLNFGSMGVVIFFLISGFVIPSSFKERGGGNRAGVLRAFAVRRAFRLYPLYWLSIVEVIASGLAVTGTLPPVRQVLANLTMASVFFGEKHMSGVYWTLQMERLHMLCAALYGLGRLRSGRVLLVLSLIFQGIFLALWIPFHIASRGGPFSIDPNLVNLPYILALMFIGSLARRAQDSSYFQGEDARRLWIAAIPWLLFPVSLLALAGVGAPVDDDLLGTGAYFGIGYFLGALLFALGLAFLRKPLRPLIGLGLVSYSLYLFHGFGIELVVWMVEDSGIPGLRGHSAGFYIALMTGMSIAVAAILYRCVEKPSMAIGRILSERILRHSAHHEKP